MGFPCRIAVIIFLLALSASRQTVFLEMFILCPASSNEHFSRSIRRRASTSAASSIIGSCGVGGGGYGLKPWIGGVTPIITGFGLLPILPLLLLWHHLWPNLGILNSSLYVIYHKIFKASSIPKTKDKASQSRLS